MIPYCYISPDAAADRRYAAPMLSRFFRRGQPSPLADFLIEMTPKRVARVCERSEGSDDFVALTIGLLMVSTAGHFMRADAPKMKVALRGASRETTAFEALAFSAFTVREYYEPIDSDFTEEHVNEAFKDGFAVCRSIIEKETGNDQRALFERRLIEYAQVSAREGMKGVAETFRFTLQSIGNAAGPKSVYGAPALDLKGTIEAMAIVHAFTATMPKAAAESLRDLADHYGFF